ncbi:hypothetical protein IG631_20520 [Alternaria alternata]|nr:hypothetical protein IG631_20520 [Alternaria alternata]
MGKCGSAFSTSIRRFADCVNTIKRRCAERVPVTARCLLFLLTYPSRDAQVAQLRRNFSWIKMTEAVCCRVILAGCDTRDVLNYGTRCIDSFPVARASCNIVH